MTRILLDANVFLHSLGSHPVLRPACQAVLGLVARQQIAGEASALMIDEIVHVRHRRLGDRRIAVTDGRAASALCIVHPVTERTVEAALDIFAAQASLQMRDAIHVATARQHGLSLVMTTDRGFDDLPGLCRVDPTDTAAVAALTA